MDFAPALLCSNRTSSIPSIPCQTEAIDRKRACKEWADASSDFTGDTYPLASIGQIRGCGLCQGLGHEANGSAKLRS
jgi:hypothetical protein